MTLPCTTRIFFICEKKTGIRLYWAHMVPAPYGYCFKLFDFFRSCKILFGLVKFKTAPDRMSGNVLEVFVNTEDMEQKPDI